MAYRMRRGNCAECGKVVERRAKTNRPLLCYECSIGHATEAARQMSERSGPYYDRFRAAKGLPPTGTPTPDTPALESWQLAQTAAHWRPE